MSRMAYRSKGERTRKLIALSKKSKQRPGIPGPFLVSLKLITPQLGSYRHSLLLTAAPLHPTGRRILKVLLLAEGKFPGSQALNFHPQFLLEECQPFLGDLEPKTAVLAAGVGSREVQGKWMVPEEGLSLFGVVLRGQDTVPEMTLSLFGHPSPGDSGAGRTHMTICFLCSRKSLTCEQVGLAAHGEERVYRQ